MSADPKQKVIKLLRLADDREGTPEGETARRLAESIMETHGFTVEQEAVDFETPSEIIQALFAEDVERRWWQEMLLVTLCDIYGGEAVSMSGEPWRLYVVVEPADEVDVPRMQQHFEYLCALVRDLCDACATEFMRALPLERERAVSSFCIGSVFRVSQLLYQDTTGEEPNLEQMPFMLRALKAGSHETIDGDVVASGAAMGATSRVSSLQPYESFTSMGGEDREAPEVVEIVPDWHWFDCGYRNACTSIHHVYEKG